MASGNESYETSFEPRSSRMVNDLVLTIFVIGFQVIISGAICFFGIVANVINLIVFIRQGFKDTVNISLFSLAISDIGTLIPILWASIGINPFLVNADLPFDLQEVVYLTAGWPGICFSRISGWITAFITLERCLCIAVPLKVKTMITVKRTVIVLVSIYVTMIGALLPVFYAIRLEPRYSPLKNETKFRMVYIPNGFAIERVLFLINAFSQLITFGIVIICSIILVKNLISKSKWRKSTSNSGDHDSFSNRDKKVVKLVLFIAIIFIVCLLPSVINFIAQSFEPEYTASGKYEDLFFLIWSFSTFLTATNSAVNIFVYYNMSSKYKQILDKMFLRGTEG
ncbi:growth hormone secretagogue receptor type 1-like [Aplysia californica]|uniref:Growth hormone secretagogue receptor type 1-like n=1 Tax=Aplysia californica TaxID=6500 RepID=A0ABM1A686_APLCA|nr:growth hormone secretagogue receptor type 1-like [Aplysia californica]